MEKPARPTDPSAPRCDPPACADADLCGQVLDDFKVLRRLGQGGMGQVYLAEQLSLRRQVALKVLRPELADGTVSATASTSLARFKAEAEAVARAAHANIVPIYAIGRAAGLNYMALEYVEGSNLREYVERKKPIALSTGLKVMAQIAAALARAGELQIVHRDVKPENILISRKGEVKVADFGLSRCFDRPADLTGTGVVMGTPLYMSPEQVDGKHPVDHRSDLYSFGATCYFLFAGQAPFRGDTPIEVAFQHVHGTAEPLATLRPDLPAELCAIVGKLMAKQPADRYQTAREVARAIARLREQTLAAGAVSATQVSETAPVVPAHPASWTMPVAAPPPRRVLWLAAFAVLVALAGGVAIGWYRQAHAALPDAPVVAPPADEPDPVGPLFTARAREDYLRQQFQGNYKAQAPLDLKVLTGLEAALELGLLYLDEHRLDEADTLFKDLCPKARKNCPGRMLSHLGQAMVLAFRNEPAESNKSFVLIVPEMDKLEKWHGRPGAPRNKEWPNIRMSLEVYDLLWKDGRLAPALRASVARALHFNYENDAKNFPALLDPLRRPPRAVLKS